MPNEKLSGWKNNFPARQGRGQISAITLSAKEIRSSDFVN
jgi:hypothetical protein